jgi:hemolysin activation/secretion protein
MKLKIIFIAILLFSFNSSFARDITPVQVEHSQEILRQDEALTRKIEQPQKVFVKEVILPQGCLIPQEEIEKITSNFVGHWHSLKEIQELLDILTQVYQKACPGSQPQATYVIDANKLRVSFEHF